MKVELVEIGSLWGFVFVVRRILGVGILLR